MKVNLLLFCCLERFFEDSTILEASLSSWEDYRHSILMGFTLADFDL